MSLEDFVSEMVIPAAERQPRPRHLHCRSDELPI